MKRAKDIRGRKTYIIVQYRNIKVLSNLRIFNEPVSMLPSTVILQLRGNRNEPPDHVKFSPVNFCWIIRLVIRITLVGST